MKELDIPTTFVFLGLQINRHFPGYVDSYYGPPELRSSIEKKKKVPLSDLSNLAESLEQSILTDLSMPVDRRENFLSELCAMRMTLRILQGDIPDVVEEVQHLYGVKPQWIDESVFEDAHHILNDILPGTEPLAKRINDFLERSKVPPEIAAPVIRDLMEDFRKRTCSVFSLPSNEICEYEFVRDKPWVAYNWFLGNSKSRIEFNQDFPIWMIRLPYIVSHEAYPGHHTEHVIKEEHLYHHENRLEHSILLNNTPSALISEGIATNALELIASQEEISNMFVHCSKAAGLHHSDVIHVMDFGKAMQPLNRVTDNQILMLYRDHASDEEIIRYGIRYALSEEKIARQSLSFIKDPLWRSYSFNYTIGRNLVSAYLDASKNRTEAYARLLREPFTPGQIERVIKNIETTNVKST